MDCREQLERLHGRLAKRFLGDISEEHWRFLKAPTCWRLTTEKIRPILESGETNAETLAVLAPAYFRLLCDGKSDSVINTISDFILSLKDIEEAVTRVGEMDSFNAAFFACLKECPERDYLNDRRPGYSASIHICSLADELTRLIGSGSLLRPIKDFIDGLVSTHDAASVLWYLDFRRHVAENFVFWSKRSQRIIGRFDVFSFHVLRAEDLALIEQISETLFSESNYQRAMEWLSAQNDPYLASFKTKYIKRLEETSKFLSTQ